eukprot:CAMPEP_0205811124 /NCGR_PEP_ID=MMETSP0205-20121125/15289_1 /ASSEMBLY_ACC=CAM_ASM_000278 /TAXON_ID=36767 /ORGANISM="Euplotes focardii, Strain TN1" /LENGTH=121 /DNA_ID=CAMNT_0053089911 /DNA_START=316 /DNA_END=678 /DNA_ORIENTATION=-
MAKEQEVVKNFIFISSEKAPPFLNEYLSSKKEAEEYLLNSCNYLNIHIVRPGFIVQAQDRSWSPFVGCVVNIVANLNEGLIQKTPLADPLDFLFPARATPLETIADVVIGGAHEKLPPKVW